MKTIFIPIFHGATALNVLRTDILQGLLADVSTQVVVLFKDQVKLDYYSKIFPATAKLKYVLINDFPVGRWERIFSLLKVYLLRTETMDLKRQYSFYEKKNFLRYFFSWFGNRLLARKSIRRLIRSFDYRLVKDDGLTAFYNEWQPSLVFLPHLFGDEETAILRAAKRRGIASIGFINSWDKLTSRSILRLLPDWLIVPNEITKQEAINFHDMPVERIFISGPPQFDFYKKINFTNRRVFLEKLGWPTDARFILFCPMGKTFSDSDWKHLELLDSLIKRRLVHESLRVLVRFPPNDTMETKNILDNKRFVFVKPGVRFSIKRGVDWDMTPADLQSLADSIHWSELVICPPSTVSIDAALLDKPVINLKFDFVPLRSFRNILRFYDFTHYKNLLKFDGIKIVENPTELLTAIQLYLQRPESDRAGRNKIALEQIGRLDGDAGRRIANFVLDILRKS